MTQPQPKKSDLGVRVASALVMVAVAGTALWLGGWVWAALVAVVALGVLWEWWGLVCGFVGSAIGRAIWLFGGICYVGIAASLIALLREGQMVGWIILLVVLLGVIGTDIGAYFAGRAIGGPKIAPSISPSKTWAGLGGGMLGAAAGIGLAIGIAADEPVSIWEWGWPGLALILVLGAATAMVAQAGDFFESWMKRRAGVKDSGKLLPGHGGLFDRTDGLIAVCFVIGAFALGTIAVTLLSGGSLLPSPA